jgi:hypothetical protein
VPHELARRVQSIDAKAMVRAADGASLAGTHSERIVVIADIIERYATEHPQAADTAEGIRAWWVAPQFHGASAEDVQGALDYLVVRDRMRRIAIAGGPSAYGATRETDTPPTVPRETSGRARRHRGKPRGE